MIRAARWLSFAPGRRKPLIGFCFQGFNGFSGGELLYSAGGETMSAHRQTATVRVIQNLATQNNVTYQGTDNDRLAHHMTRLAGDVVEFDPIEQLLIGLQRAGRIDRRLMVRLQARYLRETKP
jgi:hypothetical protein